MEHSLTQCKANDNNNAFIQISLLITYLLIAIELTPILQHGISRLTIILCVMNLFFLILAKITSGKASTACAHSFTAAMTGIGLLVFSLLVGHSSGEFGSIFGLVEFLLPFAAFPLYFEKCSKSQLKRLAFFGFIVASVNMVDNLYLCMTYQAKGLNASLYAMNNNAETQGSNVGGTAFSMVCLFLFTAFFALFCESKGFARRLALAIPAILDAYLMIALQQRATIFIVGAVFCLVYSVLRKRLTGNNALPAAVFLVLGTSVLLMLLSPFLAGLFGDGRMATRFEQIANFGNMINSQSANRVNLALMSFGTFVSSPTCFLFGTGWDLVSNTAIGASDEAIWLNALHYGVGYHTDLFDNAATFGIIGLAVVATLFANFYCSVNQRVDAGSAKVYLVGLSVAFFLLLLTNNAESLQVGLSFCLCSLMPQLFLTKGGLR